MSNFTSNSTDGCLNTQMIPYNYEGPIFHEENGTCYGYNIDGSVKFYPQYGYNPATVTGAAFSAVFALLMLLHLGLTLKSKRKWLLVIALGAEIEMIGWIGRALSGHDNTGSKMAHYYFLTQFICLLIAPVFFCFAIYYIFLVIVDHTAPTLLRFNRRKQNILFVLHFASSAVQQSLGGYLAATATPNSPKKMGKMIMVAGTGSQVFGMLAFFALAFDYFRRCKNAGVAKPTRKELFLILAVISASLKLIFRGIYRTIELIQGLNGYLITHERYFIMFDPIMIIICLVTLAAIYPLLASIKPTSNYSDVEMTMRRTNSPSSGTAVLQK